MRAGLRDQTEAGARIVPQIRLPAEVTPPQHAATTGISSSRVV